MTGGHQRRQYRLGRWTARLQRKLLILAIGLLGLPGAGAQVVIVNDSITAESISQSALRAVFTARLQSLSGERLELFVLDYDHSTHSQFCRQILEVFPYQLRDAWNRATFSGTGNWPTVLGSEAQMLRRVSRTSGAIGYLSEPVDHPGVQVLIIEGVE